uniref:Uncharacterized protein n=1 Tax=Aegilops tauschii TaxID=37682 RepID=R7VYK2_AEGTA|nr:uncharacterized protein LOC109738488 [Aegilops tauschii subsp. strangulata]
MTESDGADLTPCVDRSWPASPLDNDDLLGEILLLLPPLPSSLYRASAVCQHWRRLTTDPQFLCRFRTLHRKDGPPVLGAFLSRGDRVVFRSSILDPPDRIPPKRFDLERCNHHSNVVLDCRHGHVLVYNTLPPRQDIIVCDPITGDQRRLPVPPEFKKFYPVNGAVFCADDAHDHVHGSCHSSPFKVALMSKYVRDNHSPTACVYSSDTGTWGKLISATKPYVGDCAYIHGTLIGNVLYWVSMRDIILQFNLNQQSLSMIEGPPGLDERCRDQIVKAEDGGVGLAQLSKYSIQMWQMKVNCEGVPMWLFWKIVDMHNILGISPHVKRNRGRLLGYDEDSNVIFLYMHGSVYMVKLKSMQFNKLYEGAYHINYHPFKSFCAPGEIAHP